MGFISEAWEWQVKAEKLEKENKKQAKKIVQLQKELKQLKELKSEYYRRVMDYEIIMNEMWDLQEQVIKISADFINRYKKNSLLHGYEQILQLIVKEVFDDEQEGIRDIFKDK